jgi:hypothetical protein
MMRHERFRARLTCLWPLLLDSRLLILDLRTVWADVPKGATMVTCRLALFVVLVLFVAFY